ncbi:MAG: hypothetical protein PVI91_00015 [Gammaproteobacteria bacterium]|jgi:hypothetical protein
MRFHQLALGQRFEFEGEVYVKSTPIIAVVEATGRERFIRRSANVRAMPQTDESVAGAPAQRRLDPQAVLQAFDAFYAHCVRCLEALPRSPGGEGARSRRELEAARQAFLERLRLRSRR